MRTVVVILLLVLITLVSFITINNNDNAKKQTKEPSSLKESLTRTTEIPCPTILIQPSPAIYPIKEPFNPKELPEAESFYTEPPNAFPWKGTSFDVTQDGVKEQILYANIAANHTPHLLRIVKDGYIIFKVGGASIEAQEVYSNNGFLLKETVEWLPDKKKTTRYIHIQGKFIPIWYQECK